MEGPGEVPDPEALFGGGSGLFREHTDGAHAAMPLVIQFGSEQCALCPQATLDLDVAIKTHHFVWKYVDVFKAEHDLAEELDVTALPALFIFHDAHRYTLYQKLRGTDVAEIIKEHCMPRLVLDEEF